MKEDAGSLDADAALRIVQLALERRSRSPALAEALGRLLPPNRVRRLLGPWNDRRLAAAVALAEGALGATPPVHAAAHLARALGCGVPQAAGLIQAHRAAQYPDGVRGAALALVADAEGVDSATLKSRIAHAPADLAEWSEPDELDEMT